MYKYVLSFISGAAVGSIATLLWLKSAYNKKVENAAAEIVKKTQNNKKEDANGKQAGRGNDNSTPLKYDAAQAMTRDPKKTLKYHSLDLKQNYQVIPLTENELDESPYIQKFLIYYSKDGVLCSDDGTPCEDIPYWLGEDWKKLIADCEDNEVRVHNQRQGINLVVTIENAEYKSVFGDADSIDTSYGTVYDDSV